VRTTINIDEEVLKVARSLARAENKTLGEVVSELARRGLKPSKPVSEKGFPVFDVPDDASPLTPEMVRQALEDTL
jgi:hypothetical protein